MQLAFVEKRRAESHLCVTTTFFKPVDKTHYEQYEKFMKKKLTCPRYYKRLIQNLTYLKKPRDAS